jgi:lipopolysaccharide transport system permease protein
MSSSTLPLPAAASRHRTVIAPSRGIVPVRPGELWEFRELLYLLVWRDVKVRYKQTALGIAWAVIQPLLTMVVFTVIFGRLANLPSEGVPYAVFTLCALLPWQLFAFAMTESSTSVVANQRLLTKVYFPRLILPLAAVAVGLVDFAISFVVLLIVLAIYHVVPSWTIVTVPFWMLLAVVTALAVGLWLSALNVKYRDIRYALPFLSQIWMWATPVAYSSSKLKGTWQLVYALNPMFGVVQGFRWAILGKTAAPSELTWLSMAAVLVFLVSGLYYFRRMERTFADVI